MIKISFVLLPPVWPNLPPLGLTYLAGNIKNKIGSCKVKIDIIDLNIELYTFLKKNNMFYSLYKNWTIGDYKASEKILLKIDKIKESGFDIGKLIENKTQYSDVIGFSIFSSNLYISLYIAKHLKEKFKNSYNKIFIAGGPEVTLSYISNDIDKLNLFDYLFIGESEKTINVFLENYFKAQCSKKTNIHKDKLNLKPNTKSIETRNYDIFYINNLKITNTNKIKNSKLINGLNFYENINNIKFPDYSKLDLKKYIRKKALPIFTSRGCIGKCKFCTERLLFEKIRIRNYENIIKEIEYFYKNFGIKWFTFYDSMINTNLNNFKSWMKLLIKKNIKIHWDAQILIRPEMDDETFALMKESGNINLFIGLESGSDGVLKKMGKYFNTEDAIIFFKKLNQYNLFFEISLITGFPGETEKEFEETLFFLKKNKHLIKKIAQINKFIPYKALDKKFINNIKNNIEYNKISEKRFNILKEHIKHLGYKYTEEYLGNLM